MNAPVGGLLGGARIVNGLSARDVARLAGVSASTVTRVEQGAFPKVSYDVVIRLLEANDIGPDLRPLSRPSAITAARALLGDSVERPVDYDRWVDRWQKVRVLDDDARIRDYRKLAVLAGRSAPLFDRPGSVAVQRTIDWMEAGRRLTAAGVEWANTGDSAANRLSLYADQPLPTFYVENIQASVDALNCPIPIPTEPGPRITLIPFDGASELGRWCETGGETAGMWYAAPWQVVMDCFGGVDRMLLQAERILDGWEFRLSGDVE